MPNKPRFLADMIPKQSKPAAEPKPNPKPKPPAGPKSTRAYQVKSWAARALSGAERGIKSVTRIGQQHPGAAPYAERAAVAMGELLKYLADVDPAFVPAGGSRRSSMKVGDTVRIKSAALPELMPLIADKRAQLASAVWRVDVVNGRIALIAFEIGDEVVDMLPVKTSQIELAP